MSNACLNSSSAFLGKRRHLRVPLCQKNWLGKTKDLLLGEQGHFLWPYRLIRMETAPISAWIANQRKASSLKSVVKMVSTSAVRVLKVRESDRICYFGVIVIVCTLKCMVLRRHYRCCKMDTVLWLKWDCLICRKCNKLYVKFYLHYFKCFSSDDGWLK